MPTTKPFTANMSDISQLQGTCNFWENSYTAQLTKLEIGKDDANEPATLATFDEVNDGSVQLGKVRLNVGGPHTAYIKGTSTNIAISRA